MLDVTLREDECRVRTGHAPRNLSTMRKFAPMLLRHDQQCPKRSLRCRRKTADRLTDYRDRTYALMRMANSVSRRIDWWSNSLADEKTDPSAHSPMHLADVHGIFDE